MKKTHGIDWISFRTVQQKLRLKRKQIAALVATGVLVKRFETLSNGNIAERYRTADVQQIAAKQHRDKPPIPLRALLWMSPEEAAEYSGLWKSFIMEQVKKGKINGRKIGPHGAWRIQRASLEAFAG